MDRLHLEVFSRNGQDGSLEVFDLMGNALLIDNLMLSAGRNELQVPVSEMAAGMYLLRIKAGTEVVTERFQVR